MAQNVLFVRTTKEKQINRKQYNPNALYFCTDSREFYRADQLLTDGVRVVGTYDQLPSFNVAADGILYFIEDTKNGYVLNEKRDGWLQVIYAPTGGSSDNTEEVVIAVKEEILKTVYTKEEIDNLIPEDIASIRFAGVEMTKIDGVFSIDKESALNALGIDKDAYKDYVDATTNKVKYEITNTPLGTLVDYREKEIRVMCPVDTKWEKQSIGETGNANMYYMGFKAYAPDGAVGFKEGDRGVIVDEYFDFNGDFAGTDEYGRNYSICWLALASYNATTNEWTYFGESSSAEKYIGWTYVVEWYGANDKVIGMDTIRINLANEACFQSTTPHYINNFYTKEEIDNIAINGVESITFAGVVMNETEDGVYSIDKDAALDALGISVPTSETGEPTIIATETVVTEKVTEMSDELRMYIDEKIKEVEVPTENWDGGEI